MYYFRNRIRMRRNGIGLIERVERIRSDAEREPYIRRFDVHFFAVAERLFRLSAQRETFVGRVLFLRQKRILIIKSPVRLIEREFPFEQRFRLIVSLRHNQSARIPQPRFGKFGIAFAQRAQNFFRFPDFFRKDQYLRFEEPRL